MPAGIWSASNAGRAPFFGELQELCFDLSEESGRDEAISKNVRVTRDSRETAVGPFIDIVL